MKNFSKRRPAVVFASAVFLLALASALIFSSCGGHNGGEDSGAAGGETTADTGTSREPLSTVHINIDIDKDTFPAETDAETGDVPGSSATLDQTLDMGEEYTDKFTFLCDSVIYGLKSFGMLSGGRDTGEVVTGKGGSLFVMSDEPLIYAPEFGELMTVSAFCAKKQPEYLLVSLGASDISRNDPPSVEEFGAAYLTLIKKITEASPETVVICLSVLPGSSRTGISLYDAERYNAQILGAAEAAGVYYLDAASSFAASNGQLREDCDAGDSRLSATGLVRLLEFIRTHYVGGGTE